MAAGPLVRVSITTTCAEAAGWEISEELPKTTTIAELKKLLAGPPHGLQLPPDQRVLLRSQRNGGMLVSTRDSDPVSSRLVLLNFDPDASSGPPAALATAATGAAPARGGRNAPAASQDLAAGKVQDPRAALAERRAAEEAFRKLREEHAALAPKFRFLLSAPRAVAFGRLVLDMTGHPVRRGTPEKPLVVWVLNATNELEVMLAERGLIYDANVHDRMPTVVVLLGRQLRPISAPGVCAASYDRAAFEVGEADGEVVPGPPDWVALITPPMGPGRPPLGLPPALVAAAGGAPVVVTTRGKIHATGLMTLSGKGKDGPLLYIPVRCPFSALAGDPAADYDENGWVVGVNGLANLDALLSLGVGPEHKEPPPLKDAERETHSRAAAIFWGIIDLKYDPTAPLSERVKMLETGDGRTSRFSGAGAPILARFRAKYRLEDGGAGAGAAAQGKFAVVSANKKLTHDLMESNGYGHLLPAQLCCERAYDPGLAGRIIDALELGQRDLVVLKLCNRTRAAGVLPVPVDELDEVLEDLLELPSDFESWLSKQAANGYAAALAIPYGSYEEQVRHWWSNECPFFVAERFAPSAPTPWEGEVYDGTMRVAFALRRKEPQRQGPGRGQRAEAGYLHHPATASSEMPPHEDIEVDWLGGYWKLPKAAVSSPKLRDRVISAARTAGTAAVEANALLEVYAAMGDAVQRLFGGSEPTAATLAQKYREDPPMAAYLVGRLGIGTREIGGGRRALQLAQAALEPSVAGFAARCARSFLARGLGVIEAMTPPGRWAEAQPHFEQSLQHLPSNASALYLLGQTRLEAGEPAEAAELMVKALVLDPDFKAPYVNLGIAYLRLGRLDDAIAISEACLVRHPESPQCRYHIAVACSYKVARLEEEWLGRAAPPATTQEYEALRRRAMQELSEARDSEEAILRQQARRSYEAPWSQEDDQLYEELQPHRSQLGKPRPSRLARRGTPQQAAGWRFVGYRN